MPIRRTLIVFGLILFGVPLGYFAFVSSAPEAAPVGGGGGEAETSLQFHVVARGEVASVVSAVGEIEADQSVDVAFTVAGRVAEVYVQPTDYVLEGDLLMRLENDAQRIAYDQAYLDLELAEIEQDELQGPVDADDVRLAQANVDAAWGNYQSSLSTASRAEIEAAELQVEQAQAALDSAIERRVFGGDFDEEEDVSLADAAVGEASFNLEIAQLQLQDLRTGNPSSANAALLSYEQAVAELEQVLAGPTDIELEQAAVSVTQAEAALENAEAALRKTEVRAPFDGYVTDVLFEPGALVSPGRPVAQMVDVDPLSLTVQVDEIDIGNIEPGMPARVEVDALPDTLLEAELAKIALTGTQTQGGIVNYDAEVELLEVDPRVRVGMTAEADIIVRQAQDVLTVPNAFIRLDRRRNEAFVQLVNDENEIVETQITLGLRGQDNSEVVDGLSEGDIIAADLSGNQFSLFGD